LRSPRAVRPAALCLRGCARFGAARPPPLRGPRPALCARCAARPSALRLPLHPRRACARCRAPRPALSPPALCLALAVLRAPVWSPLRRLGRGVALRRGSRLPLAPPPSGLRGRLAPARAAAPPLGALLSASRPGLAARVLAPACFPRALWARGARVGSLCALLRRCLGFAVRGEPLRGSPAQRWLAQARLTRRCRGLRPGLPPRPCRPLRGLAGSAGPNGWLRPPLLCSGPPGVRAAAPRPPIVALPVKATRPALRGLDRRAAAFPALGLDKPEHLCYYDKAGPKPGAPDAPRPLPASMASARPLPARGAVLFWGCRRASLTCWADSAPSFRRSTPVLPLPKSPCAPRTFGAVSFPETVNRSRVQPLFA